MYLSLFENHSAASTFGLLFALHSGKHIEVRIAHKFSYEAICLLWYLPERVFAWLKLTRNSSTFAASKLSPFLVLLTWQLSWFDWRSFLHWRCKHLAKSIFICFLSANFPSDFRKKLSALGVEVAHRDFPRLHQTQFERIEEFIYKSLRCFHPDELWFQ